MSSEVTIGKQNSEITKTTRPVSLQDMPPRLRERLKREEQAEAAPMITAAANSPIDEQLEWFRAYRYGLYDVAKDETEAFAHLDLYISLRVSAGEETLNIYKDLLHIFAKGTDVVQPDPTVINRIAETLYRNADIFDKEKTESLLSLFQNEGIQNSYTKSLKIIKEEYDPIHSSIRFWFFKDPFYQDYLVYSANILALVFLVIIGVLSFFNGWKIVGFISKYAVMVSWILIPLNLVHLYWCHRKNEFYKQVSALFPKIQSHHKLQSLKDDVDKHFRISNSGYSTEFYSSISSVIVCGLLLYFGIPNAERYEQNIVIEDNMEKRVIASYESALNFNAPNTTIDALENEDESDVQSVESSTVQSPREEAIRTLNTFNSGIKNQFLRQSYDCIFAGTQAQFDFEEWESKFSGVIKNESKSKSVNVVEELPNRVALNYRIVSQLRPKEYYYEFAITMVVVKTKQGWKIYSSTCKYIS